MHKLTDIGVMFDIKAVCLSANRHTTVQSPVMVKNYRPSPQQHTMSHTQIVIDTGEALQAVAVLAYFVGIHLWHVSIA